MRTSNEIYTDLKETFPEMSDFELMTLAIEQERNDIFSHAFVGDTSYPSFLEAIANQMGFKPGCDSSTIPEAIESIGERFPKEISVDLEQQ